MRTTGQFFIPRNSWKCACGLEGRGVSSVALGCAQAGHLENLSLAGYETGTKWVWRLAHRGEIKRINWVWPNTESNTRLERATCWERDMKISGRSKNSLILHLNICTEKCICKLWRCGDWYESGGSFIVWLLCTLYVKTPRLQISAWGVSGARVRHEGGALICSKSGVWTLDFPLSDNFTKHENYEK